MNSNIVVQRHLARDINKVFVKQGLNVLEARSNIIARKMNLENNTSYLVKMLIDASISPLISTAAGFLMMWKVKGLLLVSNLPPTLISARTLQNLLQMTPHKPPLNFRVSLCTQLAHVIFEVHNLHLVHKYVNNASVLVMISKVVSLIDVQNGEARTFLLNWNLVRRVDTSTILFLERAWWKGI